MVTRREMAWALTASALAGSRAPVARDAGENYPPVIDPQVALARRCLQCTSEIERLWEAHDREFERLTLLLGEERVRAEWDRSSPSTWLLSEIPARVDELDREQARIASILSRQPALSLEGAAGKVLIARELIDPRDDPYETRRLLARAAADFTAFGITVRD